MFLPTPMRKVNIFLDTTDVEPATIALARLEQLHLEAAADGGWCDETTPWGRLCRKYTDRIQRLEELMDTLKVERPPLSPPQQVSPREDLRDVERILSNAEETLEDWRNRIEGTETEIDRLRKLSREAHLLSHLDVPLEEVRNPVYYHWAVGTIDREAFDTFRFALFEAPGEYRGHDGSARHRVNVFLRESEVEPAASALSRLAGFEFTATDPDNESGGDSRWRVLADKYSDQSRRLERLLDVLGLEKPHLPPPERQDLEGDAGDIASALEETENAVCGWQDRLKAAEKEIDRLEDLRRRLEVLAPLDAPVEEIRSLRYLHWIVGRMPAESLESLELVLFRIPSVVVPMSREGDSVLLSAATDRDHAELLDLALEGLFFERVELPDGIEGSPSSAIRKIQDRLDAARGRLKDLTRERGKLARRWGRRILSSWRQASANGAVARSVAGFAYQGGLYRVSGRVSESAVDELALALENATRGRAEIEIMEPLRSGAKGPLEVTTFRIPMVLVPVHAGGDDLLIVAVTVRDHAEVLDRAMAGAFVAPLPLPEDLKGLPSEIVPDIERRLENARARRTRLENERVTLARRWGRRLLAMWWEASGSLQVARAVTRYARHENVFLISAWIPEASVDRMLQAVGAASGGRADVQVLTPAAGGRRRPPTRMRNPGIFRPFEAIVRTFGYPDYHEIDPTPLTAVTFTLMYGLMFGDVGHGSMLAAAGLFLHRRAAGTLRAVGAVLTAAGFCGVLFGFLYGSVFGKEDIIHGYWIRPLENIPELLTASVIGGVCLLSVAFFLSIFNMARTRRWGALLFGTTGLAGLWLYWGLIGGGYAAVQGILPLPAAALVAGTPAVLLVLREPLSRLIDGDRPVLPEGIAVTGAKGFFELFEKIISDVGNSLSFVRLGAFAVAHAGLMRVVFILAESGGAFGRWPILIAGTLLVVGFEGLVVGIQAMRLQYYEFFSRFFQGSGTAFRPLSLFEGRRI